MDVLFRISLFLFFLTFVESQDCTLEKFVRSNLFDRNFDLVTLAPRYADKSEVIVQCKVGHNGYFKLICNDGAWDSVGEKCQARTCGHPGEAEFADFHLEKGRDFVFNSKVIYTCHQGYQLVGSRNSRLCRDGGWDGKVPTCEPIICPDIKVGQDLRVDGNIHFASYGSVIQFKCSNSYQALYGPSEIICEDDGKWKGAEWEGQPPTCGDVKCTRPEIENSEIEERDSEYSRGHNLRYKCKQGFRPYRITSVCSLQGIRAAWSPTPACELVTCYLPSNTPSGTSFDSAKHVFSPGDVVTITCDENFSIGTKQLSSAKTLCQDSGDWSIQPQCNEILCIDPRDELVNNDWAFRQSKSIGETVAYNCVTGYKRSHGGHAKCTKDGWTPKPLCIDNRACPKLDVLHGFSQRHEQGPAYYTCDEGYKLPTKGWWASAECKDGRWQEIHQCIENTTCGDVPVIPHGKARTPSTNNQQLQISCDPGYSGENLLIACDNGEWDIDEDALKTTCRADGKLCGPPPRVQNALIETPYKEEYVTQSTVTYQCRKNYEHEGDATINCDNGEWEIKNITCTPRQEDDVKPSQDPTRARQEDDVKPSQDPTRAPGTCGSPPRIADATILTDIKDQYAENDRVEYSCPLYYTMEGRPYKTCINGEWTGELSCNKPCTVDREDMNRHNIEFRYTRDDKLYSEHNDVIQFRCKRGRTHSGTVDMKQTCVQGVMNLPTCG